MDEKDKLLDIFEKTLKILLQKIAKMHYLSIFFKKIKKPWAFFARLDGKGNFLEILRKFSKILKDFLHKIAKNALFLHIFQRS